MRISGTTNISVINRRLAGSVAVLSKLTASFQRDSAVPGGDAIDLVRLSEHFAGLQVDSSKAGDSLRLLELLDNRLADLNAIIESGRRSPDAAQRAKLQARIDKQIGELNRIFTAFQGTQVGPLRISQSRVNELQISEFLIDAFTPSGSRVIEGELISAGKRAELTIGGAEGRVAESAIFQVVGSLGSVEVTTIQGELLSDVRDRINAASAQTGIEALVDNGDLLLRSLSEGLGEFVQVTGGTSVVDVSGVNALQVSDFDVLDISANSTEIISGSVNTAAQQADVTLLGGSGGVVKSTATFTVTGNDGSTQLSITEGESLADVRDRVNQVSGTTGVTAALSGDDLVFLSNSVGSAASVSVQPDSVDPTVNVTGVNPSQVADFQVVSISQSANQDIAGTVHTTAQQAELTHTGTLGLITSNATFDLTGSLGSASFSVSIGQSLSAVRDQINAESGQTGVEASVSGDQLILRSTGVGSNATIEVNVTSGSFDVSGGNGDGTANGIDATATINGQSLTGNANRFQVSEVTGTFEIEFQPGFTGGFDTINVTSTPGEFEIVGGNGDGTGNGTDATATIDGQNLTGNGNRFTVSTANGDFSIEFVQGFIGSFDDITVTSSGGGLDLSANDGRSFANGSDAIAVIDGETIRGSDRRFTFGNAVEQFTLEFAEGFVGEFDPIAVAGVHEFSGDPVSLDFQLTQFNGTVTSVSLPAVSPTALGNRHGYVGDLISGGKLADFGEKAGGVLQAARHFVRSLSASMESLSLAATDPPESSIIEGSDRLLPGAFSHNPDRVLALLQTLHALA